MFLLLESSLVLIAVLVILLRPRWGETWFVPIERSFAQLARRRTLSVVVVGASALGIRAVLLPVLPIPQPVVHDEFSYLLAADTYAHGRLANPTHPMWVHFETFHVNQEPTYISMYYPAQGMFLGFGQRVFGHPFWGVWLSAGLMCAAICWMLQGWVAPTWALLGGFLSVIRLGLFSYWMNSYWGGAVAALGGALVLGALPRIKRQHRWLDVGLMGVGFLLIANSRPYEGIFFTIPILVILGFWIWSPNAPSFRTIATRVIGPLLVIFLLTVIFMGYYFWRATGSPFKTPFQVNAETYNPVPYFPWRVEHQFPQYRHLQMAHFYEDWWASQYQFGKSHPGVLLVLKFLLFWGFYCGPLFSMPLIASCLVLPYGTRFQDLNHRTRLALMTLASVCIGALLPVYFNPHYVAMVSCLFYLLVVMALREVRRGNRHRKERGAALARAVPLVALSMAAAYLLVPQRYVRDVPMMTWHSPFIRSTPRSALMSKLLVTPGLHLVIVRYREEHDPRDEWVYNSAEIDQARVVWARDMGPEKNLELIHYFKDRKVWLVEPDLSTPSLSPYASETGNAPVALLHSTVMGGR